MKKFFKSFLVVLLLVLSLTLVACGDKTPDGPSDDDKFWDKDGDGIADWQQEEVTITFATWAYNNPDAQTIDTLLIDAFMEKYPNITVEMQIIGGNDTQWDTNLNALLRAGEDLPDVFLVNRIESFVTRGILADLTEFYDHDPDTEFIFDNVKDLGLYKGKRYVIPTYLYPAFWIVNKSLLRASNVTTMPSYSWTWEEMEAIAKQVADSSSTTHNIGLFGTTQYLYEYPKVLENKKNPDNNWYAYGFDGEKFNFTSESYETAMSNMEKALSEGYAVYEYAIGDTEKKEWYGDASIDPRYAGYVGIWRQLSWEVKNHMDSFNFDFDVYPAPSGVGMANTDIAGVYALSEHKQAAYQLLKWMSYSEEGVKTRYELYEEYSEDVEISGNNFPFPIVDYGYDKNGVNQIWENLPYGKVAPGLASPEFIESLRNAAIQANKEVIGWDAAVAAVETEDYLRGVEAQTKNFASLKTYIQEAAMKAFNDARQAAEDMTDTEE